jgi:signal transduction histidine kinase
VVDRAIRYYKAHGRDGTVAYYNTPESVDGPWYVFIVDENRKLIANRDQSLVGRDVSELGNDVNGQNLGEIEVPEGGRWVDYVFANPATGEAGVKHSWAVLHDGVIIGSGWYE